MKHIIWDSNDDFEYGLDDERINLNIPTDTEIICIASLGLWNGRKDGYMMLPCNVRNIFDVIQGDYTTFYVDQYNVCATDTHHDGTNTYIFRLVKKGKNISKLQSLIYNGMFDNKDISRYTSSLKPLVSKVYGW